MKRNDKRARLVSIDNSVLGSVAGAGLDVTDSWAYNYLASPSCYYAVRDAAVDAAIKVLDGGGGDDAVWSAANDAANAAWNGPACSNYGWW